MSRDIRDLLGRAIGDEPPLGIDRAAIFEAGRKRLRRRRMIQSSSVVAAVVVAAVGAGTLIGTNPVPDPSVPPAASETGGRSPAPPGTTASTRSREPAATLTNQLYAVLSPDTVNAEGVGRPQFHAKGGQYTFTADIQRPTGVGELSLQVEFDHPRERVACSNLPLMEKGCVAQVMDGVTVASGEVRYDSGERQLVAIAVLPGRVFVHATASNYPEWQRRVDERPSGNPVFTADELAMMLVRAGFSAG